MALTDILFIALVMFRVYIIIYRKTQKVKENDLIEENKKHKKWE